eukprot:6753238-Pyramimonas_sp.AAC.1
MMLGGQTAVPATWPEPPKLKQSARLTGRSTACSLSHDLPNFKRAHSRLGAPDTRSTARRRLKRWVLGR